MDDREKERLKQKRLELKKRRELEEQWTRLKGLFDIFEGKGVPYEILHPLTIDQIASSGSADPYTEWLEDHFPMRFASIDWSRVQGVQRREVDTDTPISDLVRQILTENCISDGPVVVLWWDAGMPVISVALSTAIEFTKEIFEQDWDTWIFDLNDTWCLEHYHEGMLSFGRFAQS